MLRVHMDDAICCFGITTPQYAVLSQLQSQPGISNSALARASFVTAQTMHGIVCNLEK
jgi:DNA-binding MarR family transcriptional regulator